MCLPGYLSVSVRHARALVEQERKIAAIFGVQLTLPRGSQSEFDSDLAPSLQAGTYRGTFASDPALSGYICIG